MNLTFHPAVERDVRGILTYYRREGGERLADRFLGELQARLRSIPSGSRFIWETGF